LAWRQYICKLILRATRFLIFLGFIAISSVLAAQTDTGKAKLKVRPLYISMQDIENLNLNFQSIDTTLNAFHQLNPYRKQNKGYQDLGLVGTPMQALSLSPTKQTGFDLGFNRMNDWMFKTDGSEERLIISPNAYSALNYAQGEKELIFLEVLHTQNITRRWNAGLDFRRLKTNNYLFFNLAGNETYTKIRVPSNYNLRFFTSYRSKSDKYYVLGSVTFNKYTLRESGGLLSTEAFDTTSGKRRVFENPLTQASSSMTQPTLFIKQFYRFGKTSFQTQLKDSNAIDTVSFDFAPKGYFYHTLRASRSVYKYIDLKADTPYYPSPKFDVQTLDSMVLKELSNAVGLVLKSKYKGFSNIIKMGAEQSNYGVFNNHGGQLGYYNLSVNAALIAGLKLTSGEAELQGKGQFFVAGYNQKDFLLQASGKVLIKDKIRFWAQISSQQHAADYFQSRAFTNQVVWIQKLTPTLRNGLEGSAEWIPLKLKAGFTVSNFKNYYLYYNNSSPKGVDFNYLEIYASNLIKLGKFYWHNRLSTQQVSETYHLPKLTVSGGVYFENRFFKKNMLARIGVDYYWFSSYYADAYNPFLRQFVWQNNTQIGNYPYIDVYASAQIQTMNLFIRLEHVNQGISGNRYYSTPLYPNPPRFFRFGVNWRLFN
jgi:hypothetical protein